MTAVTAFGNFLDIVDAYKPNCPSVNYAIAAETMTGFSYNENMGFAGEDVLISAQFVSAGIPIRYVVDAWVLHDPSLMVS